MLQQAIYTEAQIQPLRAELTNAGFSQILTAEEASKAMNSDGYVLYVINSVCCCAANNARPAAIEAFNIAKQKGLNIVGVSSFAGADIEAVNKFRELTSDYMPSSPCIGLFKNSKLLTVVERRNIEKSNVPEILSKITPFFES